MTKLTHTQDIWQARYAQSSPLSQIDPLVARLMGHRSVRAYSDRAVEDDVLLQAIAAAQSASTSSNLQAWSVVAVRDPAKRARLSALCGNQRHINDAPVFLIWLVDWSRLRRIAATQDQPSDGTDYLESYTVGVVDAALAAQNAAVALEALGLGLVYIGGIRNHPEDVAAELGLPSGTFALVGMSIGYPDPARPADIKPRLSQATILHNETYDSAPEQAAVAAYDAAMVDFQRAQGRGDLPWSATAVQRVKGPGSLSGRERLRDALQNLGLPLI
ncbi:NADPH-dependent oxidoreductase [Ketogulonicigenium vulgare]|uniref:Nitroreductase family protein n=1 Tax=Ketogulonicigenium vulgare (strain WSH-001) TaxID=759362 RepID=F9Y601_KETVW|nr:NADPH-dependent oxidoreductase [Ketogulonicigenium vulgare]ADO42634.1 nitroreductase family protein [Ketogulonicigenium vulgare Y25]AEM40826.1 Nitroreductase family protein [Ketogulonicigenium vulgare WSH-001]ALJ80991.1 NADPH-dependent oxidoreductase [Ketogulonicigenium vulgare]ANW33756.1 NADPH-dependent oxidoreductase [Ketogulonicigenium vulgare]AOZ54544.1 nitroreductase [Ketogulonicigenium vulgare]